MIIPETTKANKPLTFPSKNFSEVKNTEYANNTTMEINNVVPLVNILKISKVPNPNNNPTNGPPKAIKQKSPIAFPALMDSP